MSRVHRQADATSLEFRPSSSPSSPGLLTPMHQPRKKARESTNAAVSFASSLKSLLLHLICALGLASAFWVAFNSYSLTLIKNSAQTSLLFGYVIEASVVILVYSLLRRNPDQCSYVKAIVRGLLGLFAEGRQEPVASYVDFMEIDDGAPGVALYKDSSLVSSHVSLHGIYPFSSYVPPVLFCSSVYSVRLQRFLTFFIVKLLSRFLQFVPAASVFGSSWTDWHRIFAQTKPIGSTDFMICFPAHGAVLGAWFGAWPMPLDWERPWQEWPICVTYGAIFGYLLGLVVSFGFVVYHNQRQHGKGD
ncbi:Phosphatidylinositol-glycan biosynthesis class F protein [Sesamum angolense]|uniref:Phosphatidylinositol-glycan biosynthesis class F protein n=1 Tax=Sesamum angolense TaxID=2727404 RepID=A0AAE2BRS0_9LAMI|nr:Phosphatidylinositol-glycan biosynthesis class F protein [Sesamum angolense]